LKTSSVVGLKVIVIRQGGKNNVIGMAYLKTWVLN